MSMQTSGPLLLTPTKKQTTVMQKGKTPNKSKMSSILCPTIETIYSNGSEQMPVPFRKNHPPHKSTGQADIYTFYPTWEEFKDFSGYIKKIEATGAHSQCGICKVVPPEGWHPRPTKKNSYSDIDDYVINNPVKEKITGRGGIYMKENSLHKKKMTVKEFRKLANSAEFKNPHPELTEALAIESEYFKNITHREPIYGADTEGSIYDSSVNEFNMNKLGTILDDTRTEEGKVIKGVNTVYLYFGMYKATFPWHAEDMDLYSINYLHFGAPKYWFAISSETSDRFERIMGQTFHGSSSCEAFLRHKNCILAPNMLKNNNIPYGTMIQRPNEFIITFPKGYHMGFNLGYNCAESTNFASDRWIDFGKNAVLCKCRPDMVEISMIEYMKKYRETEVEAWHDYWYEPKPAKPPHLTTPTKKKEMSKGRKRSPAKDREGTSAKKACKSVSLTKYGDDERLKFGCLPHGMKQRKELAALWSNKEVNLFLEKEFNKKNRATFPHCAVCQYFRPLHITKTAATTKPIPEKSLRALASNQCFTKDPRPSVPFVGEDRLLTCSNCEVTVHASCYSATEEPTGVEWKCLRCRCRSDILIRSASCSLCELRGGALIPCQAGTDPAFAHVACAIMNRRTAFKGSGRTFSCYTHPPKKQSPITNILNYLPSQYLIEMGSELEQAKFQCDLCGVSREGLIQCHACTVTEDSTPTLVHATCAREAGYLFEERQYPTVAVLICDKHYHGENLPSEALYANLRVNENVLAVVSDDEREWAEYGKVEKIQKVQHCLIDFVDSSSSTNTLVSDIRECSCIKCDAASGKHQIGSRVKVAWNDNQLYDGYYRGTYQATEVTVRLSDNTSKKVLRGDIYSTKDVIPTPVKRMLKKISQ